jgi:cysteinyl-tRNA synthetase
VLWKPSTHDQPGWESPWGRGRPGWHIECSAMSEAQLGVTLDIHTGGNDLMFPHHENEIAQSTCAHGGTIFARYWLHNGFVTVEGRKMSKSLGNVLLVNDLRKQAPPEALRFLLLKAHYRQPLDWSEAALTQSLRTLDGMYGVLRDLADVETAASGDALPEAFEAALCDDLNTPEALAALSRLADAARKSRAPQAKAELLAAGKFIGLLQQDPEIWFKQSGAGKTASDEAEIDALVAARNAARAAKDFAGADRIRAELTAKGVVIEDGAGGTRWRRSSAA